MGKSEKQKYSKAYYITHHKRIQNRWAVYYKNNKEKEARRKKIWYLKNRKKVLLQQKKTKKNYYEKYKKGGIFSQGYRKLSLKNYSKEYKKQNGKCLICNKETKLFQDHCHKSLKYRGLLCIKCNIGLGQFNDSVELLQNAIKYINLSCYAVV